MPIKMTCLTLPIALFLFAENGYCCDLFYDTTIIGFDSNHRTAILKVVASLDHDNFDLDSSYFCQIRLFDLFGENVTRVFGIQNAGEDISGELRQKRFGEMKTQLQQQGFSINEQYQPLQSISPLGVESLKAVTVPLVIGQDTRVEIAAAIKDNLVPVLLYEMLPPGAERGGEPYLARYYQDPNQRYIIMIEEGYCKDPDVFSFSLEALKEIAGIDRTSGLPTKYYEVTDVRSDDVLNVRVGPAHDAEKIFHFSPNENCITRDHVQLDKQNRSFWWQVRKERSSDTGWVNSRYLRRMRTNEVLAHCKPRCGNGIAEKGEACDFGAGLNRTHCYYGQKSCRGCSQSCTKVLLNIAGSSCGDGEVDGKHFEECDDGNQIANDGCSAKCKTEGMDR